MSNLRSYEVWETGKSSTTAEIIEAADSFHARLLYAAKRGFPTVGNCAARWLQDHKKEQTQ